MLDKLVKSLCMQLALLMVVSSLGVPAAADTVEQAIPQRREGQIVPLESEDAVAPPSASEEAQLSYSQVPLYFQTDYPNHMFGSSTIANSGCSITSLAMVATYLTGHEYLPDELARHLGGVAENNIARLKRARKPCSYPEKNG